MIRTVTQKYASVRARVCAFGLLALALALSVPALAAATETEAQTKVKEVASSVATEGIAIFLIVVGAVGTLFALVIAVMLGFRKIRTLIK